LEVVWRQNYIFASDGTESAGRTPHRQRKHPLTQGKHRNTLDSDDEADQFAQEIKNGKSAQKEPHLREPEKPRKRAPVETDATPEKQEGMEIEGRTIPLIKFNELKEEVVFYLADVYAFAGKLFISGVMASGQTLNLVATQPLRELYFCLKSEYSDMAITEERRAQAKREIDQRLRQGGIKEFTADFVEKEYVFEIDGIPRERRPYYQVRFPFNATAKEEPKADWEGETYRYVFGTTYTPLELFIVNSGIKGPGWVKVEKNFLRENERWVDSGLCAEIQDA
jgi:hypothetical protein